MANITYNINQDDPNTIQGFEQFSQADTQLVNSFEINNLFNREKNYVELHILNLADDLLESDYNYSLYKQLGNSQSAGKEGASILTIDPVEDIKHYGYDTGDVKLLYHFLNNLYQVNNTPVEFFIQDISPDRTELKLQTFNLTNEDIFSITNQIKEKLQTQSYFSEFRLNFKNNDLIIGVNIDTLVENGNRAVVVKLYEPLPVQYDVKSTLTVVETVCDSAAYVVDSLVDTPIETQPFLRPANFNLDLEDSEAIPTSYLSYDELFSFPINNTNSQLYSLTKEKGVELSIDHTNYSNFIHFSSAYERLVNFKYKIQLIESYTNNLTQVQNPTIQSQAVTGSVSYYKNLIEGIVNNFDHYERFLYYESGSSAWPKTNSTKPYSNVPSNATQAIDWYSNQLAIANHFDLNNSSAVVNTVPSFLREDGNNSNYLTFIHMIGQHFDNLWIYTKGVSDKYNADNRLDFGVSKDLVAEVLKNFGVKLYNSNKSVEDLFSNIIGQGYVSGSEAIVTYVTGSVQGSGTSIQPTSFNDYQREIYKRIYHNLPLLLKSKGTERGLRALINCFGIPSDILDIKIYGGRNTNERPFYGDYRYYTSSLDKIRLDHTGSVIPGSTLSQYTSTLKRDNKYTDDLHNVEVGFSPTDNVDNFIISKSLADPNLATFNIDDYIGNPSNLTLNSYEGLHAVAENILGDLAQYDVRDFVRLIKFFDNIIFKTVKDFLPARTVADTGIIIKPNLLNRSKAKSVKATVDTIASASIDNAFNYTSSIDTAFTEGKHGNTFGSVQEYTASYSQPIVTPVGVFLSTLKRKGEAKFDGELSNSRIRVTDGELNRNNTLKKNIPPRVQYSVRFYSTPPSGFCTLSTGTGNTLTVKPGVAYSLAEYLGAPGLPAPPNTTYYRGTNTQGVQIQSPYTFTDPQYTVVPVYADAGTIEGEACTGVADFRIVACTLENNTAAPSAIIPGATYNLNTWFTLNLNTQVRFEIKRNNSVLGTVSSVEAQTYQFTGTANDIFTVTIFDEWDNTCRKSVQVPFYACLIQPAQGTVIPQYSTFVNTPILVDIPEIFQGQVAGAQYFQQVVTPLSNNTVQPSNNPSDWTLIANPSAFSFNTGNRPVWIKLVNVAGSCESYIKLLRTSATIDRGSILLQIGRANPTLACGYSYGVANTNANVGDDGTVYTWEPRTVYYQRISDQPEMGNLQTLWNYGKRLYTINSQGQEVNVNNWVSDAFSSGPYSNGLPNPSLLNSYYLGNSINNQAPTLVSCYGVANDSVIFTP